MFEGLVDESKDRPDWLNEVEANLSVGSCSDTSDYKKYTLLVAG